MQELTVQELTPLELTARLDALAAHVVSLGAALLELRSVVASLDLAIGAPERSLADLERTANEQRERR